MTAAEAAQQEGATRAMQDAVDGVIREQRAAETNLQRTVHFVLCADGWTTLAALRASHEPTT